MQLLAILSVVSLIFGISSLAEATSAMHQTVGLLSFVIFVISLSAHLVLGRLDAIKKLLSPEEKKEQQEKK